MPFVCKAVQLVKKLLLVVLYARKVFLPQYWARMVVLKKMKGLDLQFSSAGRCSILHCAYEIPVAVRFSVFSRDSVASG